MELLALTGSQTTLLIGLAVPFFGFLSPLILAWFVTRSKRKDKEIEWARQDQIEARLLARQAVVDKKTDRVAELLLENTETTSRKLHIIHGLVNSKMTEVLRNELNAIRNTVALMVELIEAQKKGGHEPTAEMLLTLAGRRVRIIELEEILRAREIEDERSINEEI